MTERITFVVTILINLFIVSLFCTREMDMQTSAKMSQTILNCMHKNVFVANRYHVQGHFVNNQMYVQEHSLQRTYSLDTATSRWTALGKIATPYTELNKISKYSYISTFLILR